LRLFLCLRHDGWSRRYHRQEPSLSEAGAAEKNKRENGKGEDRLCKEQRQKGSVFQGSSDGMCLRI
jgi:hypothetical protein